MTGGAQTPVTNANKIFYLNLLAQYRLASQVKDEVEHFLKGESLSILGLELKVVPWFGYGIDVATFFRSEWIGPWELIGYFWWKWTWGESLQLTTSALFMVCFIYPQGLTSLLQLLLRAGEASYARVGICDFQELTLLTDFKKFECKIRKTSK